MPTPTIPTHFLPENKPDNSNPDLILTPTIPTLILTPNPDNNNPEQSMSWLVFYSTFHGFGQTKFVRVV
jgi:hypothetical protein